MQVSFFGIFTGTLDCVGIYAAKKLQYCGPSGSGTGYNLLDPAQKQVQVKKN
jgi:hypothetical protein